MDMLQVPRELETGSSTVSLQSAAAPHQHAAGRVFLEWLREGIHTHRLVVNDSKAKVHTVNGTFFLVTPGIFQRYISEQPEEVRADPKSDAWRHVQRQFEKLAVHMKKTNGQNIWICRIRGTRKASSLNGYLLSNAKTISSALPADNPFLTLMQ
ncbi:hypothetical protein D3C77_408780 [compost metagenome]